MSFQGFCCSQIKVFRELGSNRQPKLVTVSKFGGFRRKRWNDKSTNIGEIHKIFNLQFYGQYRGNLNFLREP